MQVADLHGVFSLTLAEVLRHVDAATGCPDDYTELFIAYFPMMRGIVLKSGIAPEDVEDIAMEILIKFMEKEGLASYDPEKLHEVSNPDLPGPKYRKAKFRGMLRGFTAIYVMQFRDKQAMRHKKEPYRLEMPVQGETLTWGDMLQAPELIEVSDVALSIRDALTGARRALVDMPKRGKRDLVACFDAAVAGGLLDGVVDRKRLGATLGVSESTVGAMLREIRGILRPLLRECGVVKDDKAA